MVRPRDTPRNRRLTIIIQSQPAEGVADVLRDLRDAAVNHERPLRCVHDPTNQMRMTKQTHGFNPDAWPAGTMRRRRDRRAAAAERVNANTCPRAPSRCNGRSSVRCAQHSHTNSISPSSRVAMKRWAQLNLRAASMIVAVTRICDWRPPGLATFIIGSTAGARDVPRMRREKTRCCAPSPWLRLQCCHRITEWVFDRAVGMPRGGIA
jgi:hypothetical protein